MKVPKAKKTKMGVYRIQLRLGGQSYVVTDKDEKKCIKKAEKLKADFRNDLIDQRCAEITLREAIDTIIESKRNSLSPSTIRNYKSMQDYRFQSVMDTPLSQIKDWQGLLNIEAGKYAPKTVRNAWGLITPVLRAYKLEVPDVKLPQKIIEEKAFLEPKQIPKFLKAIEGHPCELAAILALHSLRRSELLAVEKSDVNLKENFIRVHGSVVPDENNKFVLKKTNKNDSSTRLVPIMIPRLVELVKASPDGQLVREGANDIYKRINKVCVANGLPEVGLHGLRHTFASLCYHLNIPQRQAMEIGGWKDAGTMDKIYTHLAQIDRAKSKNKLTKWYEKNLSTEKPKSRKQIRKQN